MNRRHVISAVGLAALLATGCASDEPRADVDGRSDAIVSGSRIDPATGRLVGSAGDETRLRSSTLNGYRREDSVVHNADGTKTVGVRVIVP